MCDSAKVAYKKWFEQMKVDKRSVYTDLNNQIQSALNEAILNHKLEANLLVENKVIVLLTPQFFLAIIKKKGFELQFQPGPEFTAITLSFDVGKKISKETVFST